MNRLKFLKNHFRKSTTNEPSRCNLTTITNQPKAKPKPDLIELEKLKPTRLTKYLPSIHPNYYIQQIKSTSTQLNRAFSKNQLLHICQSIQAQQPATNPITQSSSKQSLISFILFNHWNLTSPEQISTQHTFHNLIEDFKSNQQSHQLPYPELFLIYLDHQTKSNHQPSLIEKLTRNLNVDVKLEIDHDQPQLTVLGQLKDRQRFWNQFQKHRKSVFKFHIPLAPIQNFKLTFNQALLKFCSEQAGCYLELLNPHPHQQPILVAHSFYQNYPVQRVLKEIERLSIISDEYSSLPILIDLNPLYKSSRQELWSSTSPNQEERLEPTAGTSDSQNHEFRFLPFLYPKKFNRSFTQFNLNPNHPQQTWSRLVAPTKINTHQSGHQNLPLTHDYQQHSDLLLVQFLKILSSQGLHFLNQSRLQSVDLEKLILNDLSVNDQVIQHNNEVAETKDWVECNVYDGHCLKSSCSDPASSTVHTSSKTLLESISSEKLIQHLQSLWNSNSDVQSDHHNSFIFLPKLEHPISLKINEKSSEGPENFKTDADQEPEIEESDVNQKSKEEFMVEVYSYPSDQKDGKPDLDQNDDVDGQEETRVSFEVVKKKRVNSKHQHDDTLIPDDEYDVERIVKVWKKKLIILRPKQPTDMMIEVVNRRDVTLEIFKETEDEKKEITNNEDKKGQPLQTELGEQTFNESSHQPDSDQIQNKSEPVRTSETQETQHQFNHKTTSHSSLQAFLDGLILMRKFKTCQVIFEKILPSSLPSINHLSECKQDILFKDASAFRVVESQNECCDHQQDRGDDDDCDQQYVQSYLKVFPSWCIQAR